MMLFLNDNTASDLDFVKRILVQAGISNIQIFERLVGGSKSYAFRADENVVRFPKADIVWQSMKKEKQIIDFVLPLMPTQLKSRIHLLDLIEGEYPFSVAERFDGKICDNRPESAFATKYQKLTAEQQSTLAQDIALFFHTMHSFDVQKIPVSIHADTTDVWDKTQMPDFDYTQIRQSLLIGSRSIDLDAYRPEMFNGETALCHNDLAGSNLLINPDKKDVLQGIIDFANTAVVPKYYDFFSLYKISGKLARQTLSFYNRLTISPIAEKQIDYLALTYIGYGIFKTTDNPTPYFDKLLNLFAEN